MEKLENIVVNTIQNEVVPLYHFNESKYWYEIKCFIENPDAKLQQEERTIRLANYFPQVIEEYDLKKVFFDSPIYKIFAKMYFNEVEAERISSKERVGNETCKYCHAKAQAIMVQTRSADEATSVKVTCLDPACGKVYQIG